MRAENGEGGGDDSLPEETNPSSEQDGRRSKGRSSEQDGRL